MSLMEDFKNGHKAYYEEVPRYKNPLFNSTPEHIAWLDGWDQAKTEHDMFTDNQLLKEEKEALDAEVIQLKQDNGHMRTYIMAISKGLTNLLAGTCLHNVFTLREKTKTHIKELMAIKVSRGNKNVT